jgi:hypothetical protein
MPRACTVCNHPERVQIEQAIVSGIAFRRIAAQFSISATSVRRHKENCIGEAVQALQAEREVQSAWNIFTEMEWIHTETHLIYNDTRAEMDHASSLRALSESRKLIELQHELSSQSDDDLRTAFMEQWESIRKILFDALAPFPEAKLAVARALLVASERMKAIDSHVS